MGKPIDTDIRTVVTEALVGMISGVTSLTPPTDQPLPDFIQAPVDRAVERIKTLLAQQPGSESAEDRFEHYLQNAIDNAPEPLRRLGEYLSHVIDEDEWATAERMLNGAIVAAGGRPEGSEQSGRDLLWAWFGLSYASWLTLPRVLMHEMPEQWQADMARLLAVWDTSWDTKDLPAAEVSAKLDGKFTSWPEWVQNYRRPDRVQIAAHRAQRGGAE
ncbi:hypothetical protein J3Q00_07485 [Pseudomonas sp. D2-3]